MGEVLAMPDAYLMRGRVMHLRLRPVVHRFLYPVFAVRLRLSALGQLNSFWFGVDCWRPLSVRTGDYGPRDGSPLLSWIHLQLAAAGLPANGEVWLQTIPRVLGYAFNPVSFCYCHDAEGRLVAILADVNNTFHQHHAYLLANSDGSPIRDGQALICRKRLYVSPFAPVAGEYRFILSEQPERMLMRIDYHDALGALIRTSISGQLYPLTPGRILLALLRQPMLTVGIVWRIHWQALRLWLKHVPLFSKPHPPESPLSRGQEK
jgi:DUF1365 family protein